MSLPESLAIIDLETTGASPVSDRITEIGIVRVDVDGAIVRWSTLVNPGIPIPPTIQRFTGITDAMVADAPSFEDVMERTRALLDGAVFVAHNARFDYGFIRSAFRRAGAPFDAEVLCTVKLSRALYPEHKRHGLDALIARHALRCEARHRALGDAETVWHFLEVARRQFDDETLRRAVDTAMKRPSRPPLLADGVIEALPAGPGVYLFFGEHRGAGALPLYIGKSKNLRGRVAAHFGADLRDSREAEMARQVQHVEAIETAGELGALLLEANLIKARRPRYNRALKGGSEVRALRVIPNRRKPPVVERVAVGGTDPLDWADNLAGLFRGKRDIDNTLRDLAELYRLCPARLGLEPAGAGPCLAHQMKRCAGVCAGRETPEAHDGRLTQALASLILRPWPWPGAIGIAEFDAGSGRSALHVVDRWCLLGTASDEAALAELLASRPPRRFDLDTFRILDRWLQQPAHRDQVRRLD
ncbi:MAG: ethanolamine utilization protein [Rhodocyclaceae bacterium]|nr:ethanolamine utilization protein [Rhodocyclaceae bacterium]